MEALTRNGFRAPEDASNEYMRNCLQEEPKVLEEKPIGAGGRRALNATGGLVTEPERTLPVLLLSSEEDTWEATLPCGRKNGHTR